MSSPPPRQTDRGGRGGGDPKPPPPVVSRPQESRRGDPERNGDKSVGGAGASTGRRRWLRDRASRPPPPPVGGEAAATPCPLIRCARDAERTGSVSVIQAAGGGSEGEGVGGGRGSVRGTWVVTTSALPGQNPCATTPSSTTADGRHGGAAAAAAADVVFVRPLLVLDLNGVLCRRMRWRSDGTVNGSAPAEDRRHRAPVGTAAGTPVVPRTDLDRLLRFLCENFTLAVWTSAKRRTARELIGMLFPDEVAERLLFVWSQESCGGRRDTSVSPEDLAKGACEWIFIKTLSKVWEAYPLWDASNTLLLDDSPEKCPEEFLRNTVHPPPLGGFLDQAAEDEKNQVKQMEFFVKLAEFWRKERMGSHSHWESTSLEEDPEGNAEGLMSFLSENGSCHMGWRGGPGTGTAGVNSCVSPEDDASAKLAKMKV